MEHALRTVFTDNGPEQFEFDFIPEIPTYDEILAITPRSCSTCVFCCQKCAQQGQPCEDWEISMPAYNNGEAECYRRLQQRTERKA